VNRKFIKEEIQVASEDRNSASVIETQMKTKKMPFLPTKFVKVKRTGRRKET